MIIDGRLLATQKLESLKQQVSSLRAKDIIPTLGIIIVGNDVASQIYVRNKCMDAKKIGIEAQVYALNLDVEEWEVLELVERLNNDSKIDAIIVQLPLPSHIDKRRILNAVNCKKDVDGFSAYNAGLLYLGDTIGFVSCTPMGCLDMIKSCDINIEGARAVVVGRSEIVGKPMASLLMKHDCTVTVCHSKTVNLRAITNEADIVIAAIGKPYFFDRTYFKPSAIVIDVGINRVDDKIVGDVNFEDVVDYLDYVSPVPGGVGPMTRACLLANTIKASMLRESD